MIIMPLYNSEKLTHCIHINLSALYQIYDFYFMLKCKHFNLNKQLTKIF